ncbi:MAG: hypothetical protein HY329_18950 [Chloroflexi bacterium]|nr:hypothetical protein [Chloroflexota bacterium]
MATMELTRPPRAGGSLTERVAAIAAAGAERALVPAVAGSADPANSDAGSDVNRVYVRVCPLCERPFPATIHACHLCDLPLSEAKVVRS